MPLKRHENILIFYCKQPYYKPIKTKGKPYAARSSSGGGYLGDKQSKKVAGWITDNDGSRYPTSIINVPNETGLHPTQKPVKLFEYLINTYTTENELVLDNCIGSGTTAIACLNTNRNYIGFELDKNYYDIATERIRKRKQELSLF